nr:uncharacterized protein CTRU02_00252 [Colletotrichum truncatum]KAF6801503.1 hypothetical protein CTRU02_00252 [Colletotrichum truncatum]
MVRLVHQTRLAVSTPVSSPRPSLWRGRDEQLHRKHARSNCLPFPNARYAPPGTTLDDVDEQDAEQTLRQRHTPFPPSPLVEHTFVEPRRLVKHPLPADATNMHRPRTSKMAIDFSSEGRTAPNMGAVQTHFDGKDDTLTEQASHSPLSSSHPLSWALGSAL